MNVKGGFGLIEIMIAITIIAMVMAIAVPNFKGRSPHYERALFIAKINSLMQSSWQHTLSTYTVHRISFDLKSRTISTSNTSGKSMEADTFKDIGSWHLPTTFMWDNRYKIKQFIIEGFDEMARSAHRKTEEIFFFMMPDGITQAVTINLLDTKDLISNKPRTFSLVLNPVSAQFEVYDTFQK